MRTEAELVRPSPAHCEAPGPPVKKSAAGMLGSEVRWQIVAVSSRQAGSPRLPLSLPRSHSSPSLAVDDGVAAATRGACRSRCSHRCRGSSCRRRRCSAPSSHCSGSPLTVCRRRTDRSCTSSCSRCRCCRRCSHAAGGQDCRRPRCRSRTPRRRSARRRRRTGRTAVWLVENPLSVSWKFDSVG